MKTLLVLRHAKSSWNDISCDDHDRPLNARGQRDAPRMGRLLQVEQLVPDLVLSSTARRARETVELVVDACPNAGQVIYVDDLYLAEPQTWIDALGRIDADRVRVLIVGHNPGLELLVGMLTGDEETMPTAALAYIELPIETWSELSVHSIGKLRDVWRPRELEDV